MKVWVAVVLAAVLLASAVAVWWWAGNSSPTIPKLEPASGTGPAEGVQLAPPVTGVIPVPGSAGSTLSRPTPRPIVVPGSQAGVLAPVPTPKPGQRVGPVMAGPPAPPPPPTPRPPDPEVTARIAAEIDKVGLMLRDYRTRMGENPFGTNAEIMKAVMGDNPKQARLGPPEGQQLNEKGELVDRWGTPYFFHQMSRTDMEIRSAGPDRVLWTEDDILGR